MSKIFPYSYSSLTGFETCAHQYHQMRILKTFPRTENQAAADGTALHTLAENYTKDGIPFEHKYAKPIMEKIDDLRATHEIVIPEAEVAVTEDLKPTTFWADDCYTRGKIDELAINGSQATILDWKTGKANPFSTQLKHNSILVMAMYPEVEVVTTRYVWLKEGHETKAKVHRDFQNANWLAFEGRVIKLKKAFENNVWPKKPSGLCKNYCDVLSCEHNGKSK